MTWRRGASTWAWVVSAATLALGCAAPVASPSPPVSLTVFAAASLGRALEDATAAYSAAVPGTKIVLSTDSSATLETQIEQGAPADVFLSADTTNPQKLIDAGLVDGQAIAFAGNELTIIVPLENPAGIVSAADLGRDGVRVIAAGDEVPITRYATQLVENLAALDGYPADFSSAYTNNIVSREDNVAAVRTRIELGEGDAAIVYVSDAFASGDKVDQIPIPDGANVRATYAGVVIGRTPIPAAAHAFLDWLAGPSGQAVLDRFGFLPPSA